MCNIRRLSPILQGFVLLLVVILLLIDFGKHKTTLGVTFCVHTTVTKGNGDSLLFT
jgi:hypothetical protein